MGNVKFNSYSQCEFNCLAEENSKEIGLTVLIPRRINKENTCIVAFPISGRIYGFRIFTQ